MQPRTVEQWRKQFAKEGCQTNLDRAKIILQLLDGYGVEYGFDQDEDAVDLSNALAAMQPEPVENPVCGYSGRECTCGNPDGNPNGPHSCNG